MYKPSEKTCKLMLLCSYNFIRKKIGEETGVMPSLEHVLALWQQNGKELRESLGHQVALLVEDMWRAGVDYGREKQTDLFIEFMDASKHFRPGIKKQFEERLQVPESDIGPAIVTLGKEFYDYLYEGGNTKYHVNVAEDGTLYLNCSQEQQELDLENLCHGFDGL